MISPRIALFMAAIVAFSVPAQADPLQPEEPQFLICKGVPAESWGSQVAIENIVKDMGYVPFNSKIEKGCWEVKAHDPQGEVYEFYINPVSEEVVLRKHKPKHPEEQAAPTPNQ